MCLCVEKTVDLFIYANINKRSDSIVVLMYLHFDHLSNYTNRSNVLSIKKIECRVFVIVSIGFMNERMNEFRLFNLIITFCARFNVNIIIVSNK